MDAEEYTVVNRYINLSIGGKVNNLAEYFAEIEGNYSSWEDLKNIQSLLPQGILKRMIVQLMAKSATSIEQLDVTLGLCDKYNQGPVGVIEKRRKELLSSSV